MHGFSVRLRGRSASAVVPRGGIETFRVVRGKLCTSRVTTSKSTGNSNHVQERTSKGTPFQNLRGSVETIEELDAVQFPQDPPEHPALDLSVRLNIHCTGWSRVQNL